ncbi:hypothetical protein YDYSY3_39120 [Paenibacillus chitinolyticus]|uniref:RES domain-containing protein n=1 Tax=Paenibacillus chitinolyticus TaxID=79263 RepID=UPI0026E50375|nr:RES domain-containing protein [Paenibacillus chitinolyticus]GKS12912.1 hypothetical protein YDYSY3_39120 [Paenibacillus chitinolyticus]
MKCCVYCFNNKFIKQVVLDEQEKGICNYCDMEGKKRAFVADTSVVGNFIRSGLSKAYKNATTDDVPYLVLSPLSKSISDVLRYKENIFRSYLNDFGDIEKLIRDLFESSGPSYREISQGDFDEWEGGDASVVLTDEFYISPNDNFFSYNWDEFTYVVKHVNRFFDIGSSSREEMLQVFNLFFEQMKISLPEGSLIWRARRNPSGSLDTEQSRSLECGPPRNVSIPLRMNPAGISYFYGSEDRDTCKEEIRSIVGEHVIYGQFKTKKELKVVDLSKAPRSFVKSIFDPDYNHDMNWATVFLEGFVEEISKPIEERVAHIEYIPTQILSEYIRKLGYDGVRYSSSLTGKYNYTLFCGRQEEVVTRSSYEDSPKPYPNQVPEFTEWLELHSFDEHKKRWD